MPQSGAHYGQYPMRHATPSSLFGSLFRQSSRGFRRIRTEQLATFSRFEKASSCDKYPPGSFGHGLEQKRNTNGYTPLEALEADMETQRVILRPISFGEGMAYDFKG
jgi:hypothetical protein